MWFTDELQDPVHELGQRRFMRGRMLWKALLGKEAKCRECCGDVVCVITGLLLSR